MAGGWLGFLWVAIGGGLGSAARYGVGRLCGWMIPGVSSMLGTLIVNLVGSLMLGVVVTSFKASPRSSGWVLLLGVGFCGGLTTFSTLAMELADLMHARRFWAMLGYGAGSLLLGLLAFLAGVWWVVKS
ncbi:MAG: hypothetical protein RLZZ396_2322 [Planctomycetota bacterium]